VCRKPEDDVNTEKASSVFRFEVSFFLFPPEGRADPGDSAIPGRPVMGEEQAPANPSGSKNQLISKTPIGVVPEIKPIRTDTTL